MAKYVTSARVRKLRETCELTQQQFAERCDISYGTLKKIERDKRPLSLDSAVKIARATGVALAWLSGEHGSDARPLSAGLEAYTSETYGRMLRRSLERLPRNADSFEPDGPEGEAIEYCAERIAILLSRSHQTHQLPLASDLLDERITSVAEQLHVSLQQMPRLSRLQHYLFGSPGKPRQGCALYLNDPFAVTSAVRRLSSVGLLEWANALAASPIERENFIEHLETLLDLVRASYLDHPLD